MKRCFPEHDDALKVREGYFAVDKKNNEVEIDDWHNSKSELDVKAKSQEDIDRGISLILERKDELISFEEPLSFIFSHPALREGWDNPNVFTLCTLKNGSSDIAKKQEIGRGLRLSVDITGNRCLDADVNKLTVIANDSYETFSRLLQDDFNDNIKFNKNELTADILTVALEKVDVALNDGRLEGDALEAWYVERDVAGCGGEVPTVMPAAVALALLTALVFGRLDEILSFGL